MAKIAITTIPYWGHINVTLSVGALLLERGHEVVWLLAKKIPGLVLPTGGQLHLTNAPDDKQVAEVLEKLDSSKSKPAFEGSKFVMEEVLLPLGKLMYPGLRQFLEEYQPDLIIHDEQTYVGGICAHLLAIPYVTTHAAPSGIYESTGITQIKDWYLKTISDYQQSFGLEPAPLITRSKKLGLTFCPKDFADLEDLMQGQILLGPCLDVPRTYLETFDFSRIQNSNKKIIMVSIGTLLTNEASNFFSCVVNALKDSDYQVIVITDPQLFDNWPKNFIVQSRIPHLEVIKHIDLVITHGGANTVCDCIGMGVPLVVVPMAYDQYYVGDQVANNGMGIRLKYKRLRAEELRGACDQILEPGSSYLSKVNQMAEKLRAGGGATRAANLVEDFILKECC
jgi:MGT family glycosyltransferase